MACYVTPLSLCEELAEVPVNFIIANNKIQVIQIGDDEIKIVNFTDNTTIFLTDITRLNRIQMILKLHEDTYSSETIFPKSQALWAGAYENRIDQPGQMQWSQFSVKILGFLDDWKKIIEALLPEKEDFYSHLNIEDIGDPDYTHKISLQIF